MQNSKFKNEGRSPNSFFQFKQFTVHQEKCAMKVTTDACLFGAWIADVMNKEKIHPETALDIGAGTGLLSLMAAQRNEIFIDAVEIDAAAAEQAKENFLASPWNDRLKLLNASIQDATKQGLLRPFSYSVIFSNPPFFRSDLPSPDKQRNLALHSTELSFTELFNCIATLLSDRGSFFILVPFQRAEETKSIASSKQFFSKHEVRVRQTEKHGFFRSMLWFTRTQSTETVSALTIKNGDVYTAEFSALLKDYYYYL